jgi:hypothetical protein
MQQGQIVAYVTCREAPFRGRNSFFGFVAHSVLAKAASVSVPSPKADLRTGR